VHRSENVDTTLMVQALVPLRASRNVPKNPYRNPKNPQPFRVGRHVFHRTKAPGRSSPGTTRHRERAAISARRERRRRVQPLRGSAFGTTGWSLDGAAAGEKTPSRPDLWLETRCRNDAEACALESAGGLLTGIVGCNRCHANRPGRAAIPYKQVGANGLSSEPVWVSFRWQGRLSL